MRLNKFIAQATGMGRRSADAAIGRGRITVNALSAQVGQMVTDQDIIALDGQPVTLTLASDVTTILLNKPVGYVVSRNGQGSKTVYDLLPEEYQTLKPIGRLDKDSSGLLVMTNDGQLAHDLTHPSQRKAKLYEVSLNRPLLPLHQQMIADYGILLDDGSSKFQLERMLGNTHWQATMHEGRNRQIRRTFAALGYTVTQLHRISFGPYTLASVKNPGTFVRI
jgi:23S rRNA pseudouridine2605 synthase